MSNTKKIQPITIWTPSGNRQITVLSLSNFYDYHFDNGEGKVNYILIETNDELGATEHYKGELTIPSDLFNQWGTDDSIIWDYVMQTLNLVGIDVPELPIEPE